MLILQFTFVEIDQSVRCVHGVRILCTSSPLVSTALKKKKTQRPQLPTNSPNTPGTVVASGTNCGAFTKLLLGSQNEIPCHRCGRGVLI